MKILAARQALPGGSALMTTVSEMGVTQRVVRRWPEDKVGEVIVPHEIDWAAWRGD
jgi:hypothetical protein